MRVAWTPEQPAARSLDAAIKEGTTHIGEDSQALASHPQIDVIVECGGHPIGGLPLGLAHGVKLVRPARKARA